MKTSRVRAAAVTLFVAAAPTTTSAHQAQHADAKRSHPKELDKGRTFYNTGTILPPGEHMRKILLAISVADGKRAWSYT
jgi:hypothetical protein